MNEGTFELEIAKPKLTAEVVARLIGVYQTGERTLRRWWKDGAPLLDPEAMPEWWGKQKTWGIPDKVAQAADAAKAERLAKSGDVSESEQKSEGESPVGNPVESKASDKSESAVDLSTFELEEGAEVRMQRKLVAATHAKLEEAYRLGSGIDVAQKRFDRASTSLMKLQAAERAAKKQNGELISRQEVKAALFSLAEDLKNLRESMPRRVVELCPALHGEAREQVLAAIVQVRAAEDLVLMDMEGMQDHVAA